MIDSEQLKQHMVKAVEEIRATNPMAGSITNTVTIDFVANAQLAVGGSAAMVYLPDEGEALVAGGGAIYLNMGTLFPIYEQTIPRAAKAAHDAGKPWVLDPVGLGIGSLRTQLVNELKQYKPAIVRGNASEIIALAGLWGLEGKAADLSRVRGVDTTDTVDAARDAAVALARYTGGAVVVSGEVDLITDGTTVAKSHGGSPLMSKITGCGCSQGGVLAVYACVTDPFTAAVCGRQPSAAPPSTTLPARVPPLSPMPRQALRSPLSTSSTARPPKTSPTTSSSSRRHKPCPSPQPIPA